MARTSPPKTMGLDYFHNHPLVIIISYFIKMSNKINERMCQVNGSCNYDWVLNIREQCKK